MFEYALLACWFCVCLLTALALYLGCARKDKHPVLRLMKGPLLTTFGTRMEALMTEPEASSLLFRLYFEGSNEPRRPWQVDADQPVSEIVDSTRWKLFVCRELQTYFQWGRSEALLINLVTLLYPALSSWLLTRLRFRKAATIAKGVILKGPSIWSNPNARAIGDMYQMKFGCDADSGSVGWLDFIDVRQLTITSLGSNGTIGGKDHKQWAIRLGGETNSCMHPPSVDVYDALVKRLLKEMRDRATPGEPIQFGLVARSVLRNRSHQLGSYTTLAEALVDLQAGSEMDGGQQSATNAAEYTSCLLIGFPAIESDCRYVIKSRIIPVLPADVQIVQATGEENTAGSVGSSRRDFLSKFRRLLFDPPLSAVAIPRTVWSTVGFCSVIAVLIALVGYCRYSLLRDLTASGVLVTHPVAVCGVLVVIAPFACEAGIAGGFIFLLLRRSGLGRLTVVFMYSSILSDVAVCALCVWFGVSLWQRWILNILSKLATCQVCNKYIFVLHQQGLVIQD